MSGIEDALKANAGVLAGVKAQSKKIADSTEERLSEVNAALERIRARGHALTDSDDATEYLGLIDERSILQKTHAMARGDS